MKRSIIILTAAALALGGCSGKAKDAEADKKSAAAASAKKGGKVEPHVNPWAKDSPDAAATVAAKAPAKGKKPDPKAKPAVNPWAKDGAAPASEPAKDAKK